MGCRYPSEMLTAHLKLQRKRLVVCSFLELFSCCTVSEKEERREGGGESEGFSIGACTHPVVFMFILHHTFRFLYREWCHVFHFLQYLGIMVWQI